MLKCLFVITIYDRKLVKSLISKPLRGGAKDTINEHEPDERFMFVWLAFASSTTKGYNRTLCRRGLQNSAGGFIF
jgi:hypothetical protein